MTWKVLRSQRQFCRGYFQDGPQALTPFPNLFESCELMGDWKILEVMLRWPRRLSVGKEIQAYCTGVCWVLMLGEGGNDWGGGGPSGPVWKGLLDSKRMKMPCWEVSKH